MTLRLVHRAVGGAILVLFLATGVFMREHFPAAYADREAVRFLYRANHIYLLLASLLHLALGTYLVTALSPWRRRVQAAGSALLALGTLSLAWAFFVEPPQASPERPRTGLGLKTLLAGTLVHVIAGRPRREEA